MLQGRIGQIVRLVFEVVKGRHFGVWFLAETL